MSAAPRLLPLAAGGEACVVVRSSFWRFNAIGIRDGAEACVVDPGIYPEDCELLAEALAPARVTRVVVTHSHHDHIRGWMRFPGARVAMPRVAAEKPADARARILAAKQAIDERLEIDDPGFHYPEPDDVFDERLAFRCGALDVELRFLPGHSNCTSVVWIPALRTLCTADYLVSPGLPYCRWEARAFEEAVETMRAWVLDERVELILPAHDEPLVGKEAILAALDAERDYFLALRAAAREARASGADPEECVRRAAAAGAASRGWDAGPRARQDRDNARRVLEK